MNRQTPERRAAFIERVRQAMFGEHTFFVDETGLKVLEPTPSLGADRQSGEVVSLADWGDSELTRLMAHEPEPTGVIVVFEHMRH